MTEAERQERDVYSYIVAKFFLLRLRLIGGAV